MHILIAVNFNRLSNYILASRCIFDQTCFHQHFYIQSRTWMHPSQMRMFAFVTIIFSVLFFCDINNWSINCFALWSFHPSAFHSLFRIQRKSIIENWYLRICFPIWWFQLFIVIQAIMITKYIKFSNFSSYNGG